MILVSWVYCDGAWHRRPRDRQVGKGIWTAPRFGLDKAWAECNRPPWMQLTRY